ncbi:hypothetical protein OAC12_05655, partial [Porticoccaceae bacterium]|nr:hypothetical protein [Porticoccaceae bacterium]
QRIAVKKRAEEKRISAEKQRIADSKPSVKEKFYSSGKLASRANYHPKSDGGKKHGLHEIFYENGQIKKKENYIDGERDGLFESYQRNGQLDSEICYKNGQETDMSYCEE